LLFVWALLNLWGRLFLSALPLFKSNLTEIIGFCRLFFENRQQGQRGQEFFKFPILLQYGKRHKRNARGKFLIRV
jgi:hypothetical protein